MIIDFEKETNSKNEPQLDAYRQLSTFEKECCWALSLTFAESMNQSDILTYLRRLNITHEVGRQLSQKALSAALHDLYRKSILNYNYSVQPFLQHRLVIDALGSPLRSIFLDKLRLPQMKESPSVEESVIAVRSALCLEIYLLNDPRYSKTDIDASIAKITAHSSFKDIIFFFNESQIDVEWIEQLPLQIRAALLEGQLSNIWKYNRPMAHLQKKLARFRPYLANPEETPWIAKMFLTHALHSADLCDVTPAMLETLNKNDEFDLSLYASLKFLQGHFKESMEAFEEAVTLLKKRLNHSGAMFSDIRGIYYILSVLSNQPKNVGELTKIARMLKALSSLYNPAFIALETFLLFLQTRNKLPLQNLQDHPSDRKHPITYALHGLCAFWLDRRILAANLAPYMSAFALSKDHLPGIARILAEIITAAGSSGNSELLPYSAYLEESQDLYPISFLGIVPVKEIWEESLAALELLYSAKEGKGDVKAASEQASALRMAWRVNPYKAYVEGAVEQKVNAKGQWTKGRPIALERLKTRSSEFEYATDHDRRVMSTIYNYTTTNYNYYRKEEFAFKDKQTLLTLVDHPYIINCEHDLPIEFVKGTVEVLIKEKGESFAISLSAFATEASTVVRLETNTRFQIIEFTETHVLLAKIIGPTNELLVPKDAKKRLQGIVRMIGKQIPVHSDIGEESVRKEANGMLHVHLTPVNQGMKINLFVRPFGAEGPYFKPGDGFQVPQTIVKGKPQRVLRSLEQERKSADALIAAIESLYLNNTGEDEWIFNDPENVLEILSSLQNPPEPIKLFWPNGQKIGVSSTLDAKSLSLRVKGDQDWFSLEGEIKINEKAVIDLKTLLDLIDMGAPRFVPIGDSQFLALTDHFKQLLCELKALSQADRGKLRIHALSSSALSEISESVAEFTADAQWQKAKERIQSSLSHQPSVPATLQAELRPYQVEGFQWLSRLAHWGVGACLADDMGLGKTLQALALILEHAAYGPTLVVAPTSVCHNWLRETLRFAPTLKPLLRADNRREGLLAELGPMDLLITSYGLLHSESELFAAAKWQTIVLDEAQVIKNSNTKRSQAAMELSGKVKIILTGTPLENRLAELWNLFRFINPGLLGSYESFIKRFADPIEQKKDPAARKALKKLIQPFVLRRLKNQVLTELPPRIEKTLLIPFDSQEQAFYEALRRSAIEKLTEASSNEKSRIHILAEIMRLRRACCHPSLVAPELDLPGTKLQYFLDLVEELRQNNHRALVFSQFVGCLEKVRLELDAKGISYQYLDGSTPIDERERRVNAFQNGQGDLFLISLRAGGTGLNLTAADYVVHLDPWWNPAVEDQASDRAHRIGQTRPVTIYRIIMEGTIEEKMLKLHDNKRGLATDLLDGTNLSGKLSDAELLALLET